MNWLKLEKIGFYKMTKSTQMEINQPYFFKDDQ